LPPLLAVPPDSGSLQADTAIATRAIAANSVTHFLADTAIEAFPALLRRARRPRWFERRFGPNGTASALSIADLASARFALPSCSR